MFSRQLPPPPMPELPPADAMSVEAEVPAEVGVEWPRVLVGGDGGEDVELLVAWLDAKGYPCASSRGESPRDLLSNDVVEAVLAFRRDHGIEDELQKKQGDAGFVLGPDTWRALLG